MKKNFSHVLFKDFAYLLRKCIYKNTFKWLLPIILIERCHKRVNILGKYYNLNMKIPHTELFQEEYLFLGGSTLLQVNKYSRSSYFPINNYCGVCFSGALRKQCPYLELFWSVFSRIQTEFGVSPYSVRMRERDRPE